MKRFLFSSAVMVVSACHFATVEMDDLNGFTASAVRDAIYDSTIVGFDTNEDGIYDEFISIFVVMASDIDSFTLCNSLLLGEDLDEDFVMVSQMVTKFTKVSALGPFYEGDRLEDGEDLDGDGEEDVYVDTSFSVVEDGAEVLYAESLPVDGVGSVTFFSVDSFFEGNSSDTISLLDETNNTPITIEYKAASRCEGLLFF